jgi:Raf kinase inhibitor-like YbhB/YbcL family protein
MNFSVLKSAVLGLALAGLGGIAFAQAPATPPAAGAPAAGAAGAATPAPMAKTIYDNLVTAMTPKITLTSMSIKAGQTIPDAYSQNGANKSPQLTWTAGPATTKSYVVVAQDTTTANATPVQHWLMWNVPATVTSLPEGVPLGVSPASPAGATQATAGGNAGYRGPKPPAGMVHNYVFQVFALDTTLTGLDTMTNAPMLTMAMMGHVVAAGSLSAPYTGK